MTLSPEEKAEHQRLDAVRESLQEIAEAQKRRNEVAVGRWTRRALNELSACEEARNADPGYYAHRDADDRGRTLAGLVWVRALVYHRQAEVRAQLWHPAERFIRLDGEWHPAKRYIRLDGEWHPSGPPLLRLAVWPPRDTLPAGRTEKHGRDVAYDSRVAGRPLLPPLEEAEAYLLDTRPSSM